jgi:very-short-patch-repair endonuclease
VTVEEHEALPPRGEGLGWGVPQASQVLEVCTQASAPPHPNPSPQGGRACVRAKKLRDTPTKAESLFWKLLRRYPPQGSHWRRQVVVGGLVFDFGCHSIKILIEVDGEVHKLPEVRARDMRKADVAALQGYRLIRVSNDDVQSDETAALLAGLCAINLAPFPVTPVPQPLPLVGGRGERFDAPTPA